MNKKLNYFSAISFLAKYIKGFKKHFFMFYTGWFVDSILAIVMPILFGIMIDEIVYYQNMKSFINIAILFFACILFSSGLYFLLYAQHGYLMNMFVFSIRRDVFKHLQQCDARYLTNASTGEILAILQNYPQECMHFIIRNIIHSVNGILLIILYTAYLVIIDWRIGIIAFSTGLFSMLINIVFKGKIRRYGDKEREYYGKNVSWLYEIISAIRDIRMLGAKDKVEDIFETNQKSFFKIRVKTAITTQTAENVIIFINLAIRLIIYWISAFLAVNGSMSLGTLTVIFSFYEKMSGNISAVTSRYLDSQNRISYIQKIYNFLHVPSERGGIKDLDITKGEILFQNVTFGYEQRTSLLDHITLRISPGEHVAVVGRSGCGKTTLAHLLIGFYQPESGEIKIDRQRLSDCTLESIRKGIGFVQQDVLIFDGTIRQNLLMGNSRVTEKQLIEACRSAGLGEFIDSLHKGLDTVVGSQGIGLSGGQKQRIAIARIYLKNPSIVIFDEATSALDRETEEAIHQVWKNTLVGKTAIIIAHRQSSVMLCERAVILEEGQIIEEGNPSEMIKSSIRFRTLFAIKVVSSDL